MAQTVIVIPCYDEARRLSVDRFVEFAERTRGIDFVFVNDGSRDDTLAVLRNLEARMPKRATVIDLHANRGKAEAVRVGILAALEQGPDHVGYFDADLATPLEEIPNLVAVLDQEPLCEIVFGTRVRLLGRRIERKKRRHYLGRVFATVASETLGLPVYDTQCGAKLFRVTETLPRLFEAPFVSSWVFDVEIVARRIEAERASGGVLPETARVVIEMPLREWIDVAGSKVRARDFFRALWELWLIRNRYLRRIGASSSRSADVVG